MSKSQKDLAALLREAVEFVEMAAAADNSGQEYDPTCQECGASPPSHTSGCRLALFLEHAEKALRAGRAGAPSPELSALREAAQRVVDYANTRWSQSSRFEAALTELRAALLIQGGET